MQFFLPFPKGHKAGEAGNMLLITSLMVAAMAVAGGQVALDRAMNQRKANQMAESTKRAKEIPGSAAMVAKSLISLPPQVAANKSVEWTTPKLVSTPANMPLIYPLPYVSGPLNGPAQPATTVIQTSTSVTGANWDLPGTLGMASSVVNVYTNDATRATADDINSAIGAPSTIVNGSSAIPRTKAQAAISFRNCDINGVTQASFTGRYCASATITADNYASTTKGSTVASGTTTGTVQLGLVEPPPEPTCDDSSFYLAAIPPVKPGNTFNLVVAGKGVAIGYDVKYNGTVLKSSDPSPIHFFMDRPMTSAASQIKDIPTAAVKTQLEAPGNIYMMVDVVLKGINGTTATCPQAAVKLNRPVCGSFTASRIDPSSTTCKLTVTKAPTSGDVSDVLINNAPVSGQWSGGTWSSQVPCGASAMTFSATLRNDLGSPGVCSSTVVPAVTYPLYLNSNRCSGGGPYYSTEKQNFSGCSRTYRDNGQIWHYTNDTGWSDCLSSATATCLAQDAVNGNARLEYCSGGISSSNAWRLDGWDDESLNFNGLSHQVGTCTSPLPRHGGTHPPSPQCQLSAAFSNCYH